MQKALSLYHKQTEGWRTFTSKEKGEEEVLQSNDNVKDLSDMARHEEEKSLPMLDKGIVESSPPILHQIVLPDDVMLNAEVPDDVMLDAEEVVAVLDKTVDIDKVLPLKKFMEDKEDEVVENGEDASNIDQQGEEDTTKPPGDDDSNQFAEEQCPPNEEKRGGGGNGEEGGGSLILSDIVPPLSEDDVVMPDSDNLTRIHQCSSESTH